VRIAWIGLAALAAAACGESEAAVPTLAVSPKLAVEPVAAERLCATHGELHADAGRVHVSDATFRAVAPTSSGDAASLRFTYRGGSPKSRALKSGQMRRQMGLKLRAADGCNLVYVMWRIEPKPGIEIQTKLNPGEHTNAECGTDGYTKVAFVERAAPEIGDAHALEAHLDGDSLTVTIDGEDVWTGKLDGVADLRGQAGLRTDNVSIDAELVTPVDESVKKPACPKHGGDD